jgi:hypothetical protein
VALDASASVAAPPRAIETVGTTEGPAQGQGQGQAQAQTQAQQPFFQTGLQQNQGLFEHGTGAVQPH